MNKSLYALPLLLAACGTVPDVTVSAGILASAIAYEKGVQQRCPGNVLEWSLHINARLTFDMTLGHRMTAFDQSLLARVRADETDVKCPPVPMFPIEPLG